nr:MAG TPA: hypothetical protein [Caudoviricetes sp.]
MIFLRFQVFLCFFIYFHLTTHVYVLYYAL